MFSAFAHSLVISYKNELRARIITIGRNGCRASYGDRKPIRRFDETACASSSSVCPAQVGRIVGAQCRVNAGELFEETHCVHSYIAGRCHTGARWIERRSIQQLFVGSGNLTQTLQATLRIDEYNVLVYPVALGHGKRLFKNGAKPKALRLVTSKVSTTRRYNEHLCSSWSNDRII